jgi:hypothetical protein
MHGVRHLGWPFSSWWKFSRFHAARSPLFVTTEVFSILCSKGDSRSFFKGAARQALAPFDASSKTRIPRGKSDFDRQTWLRFFSLE